MSRRLVIGLLVVLLLGVVLGTAAFFVRRLQTTPTATTTPTRGGSLNQSATGSQQIVDPTGDADADGLSNADEALWGTDPKNPDSDGDGYFDGEEVKAGFNPSIPSPKDKLPEGFVPGKDINPLPATAKEPVAVDQFFKDNLDFSLGSKNYSDDYKNQFPAEQRTPDTVATYVKAQPVVTQLPNPVEKTIQTLPVDSKQALQTYLGTAGNVSLFSNRPLFTTAINDLFGKSDPSTIQGLASLMRIHQQTLIGLKVPPQAVPLQKLLLGYTQALADTFDQMAKYNQDHIRAVVAMHQWEELDQKYVPLIEQESDRLKALAQ